MSATMPATMARGTDSARTLWTVSDAADELGVSRQTIYDWIDRGLPVYARYRHGQGWTPLFDPDQARRWKQSRWST